VATAILSACGRFPRQQRSIAELFADEGVNLSAEDAEDLGIQHVGVCNGETGSALALAAAHEALERAAVGPRDIDVIVDYSILPQEYLVPAWSMGNKLQHELGAKKAFTLGFSGGGATNFLVALQFARGLIEGESGIRTALLVGADVAITGNRILNPRAPVSVLGDGASAVVLREGDGPASVVEIELHSDGACHDVCRIAGGGVAFPERGDLYRMELDRFRFDAMDRMSDVLRLAHRALERVGLTITDLTAALYPNISRADQLSYERTFGFEEGRGCRRNLRRFGHVQGTDLVVNLQSLLDSGALAEGETCLVASHGKGFVAGIGLLRRGLEEAR
jgi:3-oxoacyl-[acyl-carrier-protein] synthase-3